jgi:uncharacterized protein (DUF58 family)
MIGRPVPTPRALLLLALGLVLAVLAAALPKLDGTVVLLDLAVLLLVAVDFLRAPKIRDLQVAREVMPVVSAGVANPVAIALELRCDAAIAGELRDLAPANALAEGHRQRFTLTPAAPTARIEYRLTPQTRGDFTFGDLFLRLEGPLGLCARQVRVPLAQKVKAYPDLRTLSKEALALARAQDANANRAVRRAEQGREFESLRTFRPGDDVRQVDWKATARVGEPIIRVQQPERNQSVLLFVDCGRQMAGEVKGRRKLDHAVDAALQLARVSLTQGDAVGVVAFGNEVGTMLPPRRGAGQLRTLTEALYRAEATLTESDYGRAIDAALAKHHRRSLIVMLTDLLDRDSSAALVRRMIALRPRHLPLVVSLLDEDVAHAARAVPEGVHEAYVRQIAARVEQDYARTAAQLRDQGALVVRSPAGALSANAVNTYLQVKARGLL